MEINVEAVYAAQDQVYSTAVPMPTYKSGKSIVTSCYRAEIPSTYILLSELRRLNFNLPIEVFYREGELVQDEILELERIYEPNVQFKKIYNQVKDFKDRWGNTKGWATKVYAIYESEYEENLWLDCDNIPIRNCLDLFDDPEYLIKGSLFWRDVYSIDRADQYCRTSDMWKIFRVPYNDAEPFESGQIVLNKSKNWSEFCMMLHFTENNQLYYNFGGDAECWRMAWQHVAIKKGTYHAEFNYHASDKVPYGMMPYGPFHKGVQNQWHKYGGGTVMVQRDRMGKELFNHRNINKFLWQGENPFNEDVTNEQTYHMIMNHIKVKYGVQSG